MLFDGERTFFFAAALGVLAFDFFFVPPRLSLTVADLRYILTFVVFLCVAGLTSSLASKLRNQFQQAQQKEANTAALYALSRKITAISDLDILLKQILQHVADTLDAKAAIILPNQHGEQQVEASSKDSGDWSNDEAHLTIAGWVNRNNTIAGRGTRTLSESSDLYVP